MLKWQRISIRGTSNRSAQDGQALLIRRSGVDDEVKSRWKMIRRLLPLFAVMTFLLAGCGDPSLSTLVPRGPIAREQYDLMKLSFAIMAVVIVVVFAIYIYVIIRFRKR